MAEKTDTEKTVDWMKESTAKQEQERREADERQRKFIEQQAAWQKK